jgi:hypothetical protein
VRSWIHWGTAGPVLELISLPVVRVIWMTGGSTMEKWMNTNVTHTIRDRNRGSGVCGRLGNYPGGTDRPAACGWNRKRRQYDGRAMGATLLA